MTRKYPVLFHASVASCLLASALIPLDGMGEILKEEQIVFSTEDLETGYGKKPWIITPPEETTKVWGVQNASQSPEVGDGRLRIGEVHRPNSAIVWKIAVPDTMRVTSFTWAVDTIVLVGTPGAEVHFRWEYSVDEENWAPLFSTENRPSDVDGSSPMFINDGIYTATFEQERPQTFYIRAVQEGTLPQGESTYYAVWSNYPKGGEGEKSYISVDVENQ